MFSTLPTIVLLTRESGHGLQVLGIAFPESDRHRL